MNLQKVPDSPDGHPGETTTGPLMDLSCLTFRELMGDIFTYSCTKCQVLIGSQPHL